MTGHLIKLKTFHPSSYLPPSPPHLLPPPLFPLRPRPLPPFPCRHEWYQTASQVTVTVLAKGLRAEQLTVQMGEQVVSQGERERGGEGASERVSE